MFTVFIADDEAKVISGLIHRVNWKKVNADVIGYADNGKEARNRIVELRPDIVITDIYMPGMTGIELINELSETLNTVFIIFSAYSEFEYAREAIHLNVADYLIKPVNIHEIETALEQAQEKVLEKRRSSVTKNEEYMLMKLMDTGKAEQGKTELYEGAAIMAVVLGFTDKETDIIKAREKIQEWKVINGKIYTVQRGKRLIIAGVQTQFDTDGSFRRWMLMRIRELRESGLEFYWGMGCTVEDWGELDRSVCAAEEMLAYSEFYQEQVEEKWTEEKKTAGDKYVEYAEALAINLDDPLKEKEIINQIRILFRKTGGDAEKAKVIMIEFLYCFREKFEENYNKKIEQSEMEWKTDIVYKLIKASTLDQMLTILDFVVRRFQTAIAEQDGTAAQGMVGAVQKYIRRHLKENISLNDIAREVDRNPTYISHVFRAVTGETLFEYITRLRMELAMKLLRESSMKIQEIAAETGYEEQSYFSQVFKKYTGKTAGSYRKMMYKDE